jgi:hypothetical protein
MKLICKLILLIAACAIVFPPARTQGQAILDRTTLGRSQNDSQDLVNSLVPGPQSYGKRDKKEQVNPAELKSKTIKDSTFGGSLLDMGIVGAAPKLDEQKLHTAPTGNDSKAPKEAHPGSAKDSKQSEVTASEKESKGSAATAGGAQNKEQRSTSAVTDQKLSANSTEKLSAAKPDGGGR